MNVTVCNRQRLRKVNARRLKQIAQSVGAPLTGLSIVLVDDVGIAPLNKQFHHTDGPTDVLSFDYGEGQGELIVSVEHAVTQARQYRSTPSRELALYVIHGLLHLTGYDDLAPRARARMRAAECKALAAVEVRGLIQSV